jgi:hypothetical protein
MLALVPAVAHAADKADAKPTPMSLAGDNVSLTAPADFIAKKPGNNIIAYEFSAPKVEGDERDGRLTVMTASGSVDANIDRWIAQFSQPDGKPTKDRTEIKKETIGGQEVHIVDISGTFSDRPGPFAPGVNREGYRMLGAIIVTADHGQHFLKFYGPAKTIAAHEKAFDALVKSLKVAE